MKKGRELEFNEIIIQLEQLIRTVKSFEKQFESEIDKVHPRFRKSARNLVHYWAVRQGDIRVLQNKLKKLGLSRLGKAEAHILASMQTTLAIIRSLSERKALSIPRTDVSIAKGEKYLSRNTKALLGAKTKGRKVRIMVTQPAISAEDRLLVDEMMLAGMNTARINCAHDDPDVWKKIIDNIKSSSVTQGVDCKVAMDLGGPKVRTSEVNAGPRVLKLRPIKNELGQIVKPLEVHLVKGSQYPLGTSLPEVPVSDHFFECLTENSTISLFDTRNKKRKIRVVEKKDNFFIAHVDKTTFIRHGTNLNVETENKLYAGEVGELPEREGVILLKKGDTLELYKEHIIGSDCQTDHLGNIIRPARISFSLPEIFDDIKVGKKVIFDDGKIEGIVRGKNDEFMSIQIVNSGIRGSKLRADKGINFPDSKLNISGLTEKDKEDLKFVSQNADVVNFSFVNSDKDVKDLFHEMELNNAREDLGVIYKIETQRGYRNLFKILLTAMQHYPFGVMIARGDLAIECGWENMARIQEEILSLCNAAHVPVIWATQVLENMAKKGLPSRSEITDAATAQRAECIMLNKGPNIIDAIKLLDIIIKNLQDFQEKKASMLPAIR